MTPDAPPILAHVLSSFAVGGAERVALQLATAQVRSGWRVLAVSLESPEDGVLAADFARAGAELVRVPKEPSGFDPSLYTRLARVFHAERVALVHTHNALPLIAAAPAAKLVGARVVHTRHGAARVPVRRRWVARAAALAADTYVAVSESTADHVRAIAEVQGAKLAVVPNGVDVEAFSPSAADRARARAELGIPDGAWVVGTVGRMDPVKNHALLVDAAAPLLGDRARLVIVGDGPAAADTREAAARAGVARCVHFTGMRRDVARLLGAFDAFALSSRDEGLPLAVLEAMAAGLPVVATRVGGVGQVVENGVTGFLVEPGDVAGLRRGLAVLRVDRARGERMGTRGRAVVRALHGLDRMAGAYEALYVALGVALPEPASRRSAIHLVGAVEPHVDVA